MLTLLGGIEVDDYFFMLGRIFRLQDTTFLFGVGAPGFLFGSAEGLVPFRGLSMSLFGFRRRDWSSRTHKLTSTFVHKKLTHSSFGFSALNFRAVMGIVVFNP